MQELKRLKGKRNGHKGNDSHGCPWLSKREKAEKSSWFWTFVKKQYEKALIRIIACLPFYIG